MAYYYLSVPPGNYSILDKIYRCDAGQVLTLTRAEHLSIQDPTFPDAQSLVYQGTDEQEPAASELQSSVAQDSSTSLSSADSNPSVPQDTSTPPAVDTSTPVPQDTSTPPAADATKTTTYRKSTRT